MINQNNQGLVERIGCNRLREILSSKDFLDRFNEVIRITKEQARISARNAPDFELRCITHSLVCFPHITVYKEPQKKDITFYHLHHKYYIGRWPVWANEADKISDEYLKIFPSDAEPKLGYILMGMTGVTLGDSTKATDMRIENIRKIGLDTRPLLIEITNSPYAYGEVYFKQDAEPEPPINAAEEAEHRDTELEKIFKEMQEFGETANLKHKAMELFLQRPKNVRTRRAQGRPRCINSQWENLQALDEKFDFDVVKIKYSSAYK